VLENNKRNRKNSDEITIIPVQNRALIRRFIKFPYSLYKNDPYWVPPLLRAEWGTFHPKQNPHFLHSAVQLFIAKRFGQIVGRISAHEYREYNRIHGSSAGFFGFFEAIHSQRVANELLNAAEEWLRKRGCKEMLGPCNFTVNDSSGMLIDGFNEPPVVMMPYNPPYYPKMVEAYGLQKKHDQFAWKIDDQRGMHPLAQRIAGLCRNMPGLVIRHLDMNHFEEELRRAYYVYSNAWNSAWGTIPPTWDEFYRLGRRFRRFGNPDYAWLIELNDSPVGVGLAIPNIHEIMIKMNGRLLPFGFLRLFRAHKKIKSLRVLVMETIAGFENHGVDALLYQHFYEQALKDGIHWAELSWTLENNETMNRIMSVTGAQLYKKYRIYRRDLR